MANSIGLYPTGVDETGQRAGYAGHLSSSGLGIVGMSRQLGPRTRAQAWN